MNALLKDRPAESRRLEIKNRPGLPGTSGDDTAIVEVRAALAELQTAFDAKVQEAIDEAKAATDRADALELKLNRPLAGGGSDRSGDPAGDREVKAFGKFLRSGDDREIKTMSAGSDPDGGYTCPPQLAKMIFQVQREVSPLRQFARVIPLESGEYQEPQDRAQSVGASWVSETADRPETDSPQLGLLTIPSSEIYSQPKCTQKVLDDNSFGLIPWLTSKIGEEFAISEGAAFVNGSGLGQPRGFATYPTAATADSMRPWATFEHIATGNAGAFAASDPADCLIDATLKLKTAYLPRARWYMSRAAAAVVRKLKDNEDNYLWQTGIQAGQPTTLLGYPVTLLDDMPAIAANSLSIAFGDMSRAYTIVDRLTMVMLRDPFTSKPFVKFYTTKRVGGEVSDFHALKFIKFAAA